MIPQELVDAIVHEVGDDGSLKACSLAASNLRWVSQRILLRSIKLDPCDRSRDYKALCTLLSGSPHIATYITALDIQIPSSRAPLPTNDIREVLTNSHLVNVRRCRITAFPSISRWDEMASVVPDIIAFIRRQKLVELHLAHLEALPPSIIALVVSSASTVSFSHTVASLNMDADDVLQVADPIFPMTQLLLSDYGPLGSVSNVLGRPEFSRYTANLRRLGLGPDDTNLITAAARTIEHIRLDHLQTYIFPNRLILPSFGSLTALRTIELVVAFLPAAELWLVNNLRALLRSIPASTEAITITYAIYMRGGNGNLFRAPHFKPETMAALKSILGGSGNVPPLRWRLDFQEESSQFPAGLLTSRLDEFREFMESGLEMDSIIVERHSCRVEVDQYWCF
ncbi:hypothetical protein C8R44DRAFT_885337 [Mycena epipterygia]|nr:hypothetical protein C8R44DRAFT_885337 [Mycena epipterygia]